MFIYNWIRQQKKCLSLYANLSCNIVNTSSLTSNIYFAFNAIKYSSVLRNAKKGFVKTI